MKLEDLFESKLGNIYHATTAKLTKFNAVPTWFSLNEKDAWGWYNNQSHVAGNKTYVCQYTGGKIASIAQSKKIAKQVWPHDEYIYSMFDERVGEFEKDDVKKFIALLQKAGFDASYIDDYDPNDFNSGSSKSLVVFDPSKHVKIVGEHTFKGQKLAPQSTEEKRHSLDEFKVGDEVEFEDDRVHSHIGKILKLIPQGSVKDVGTLVQTNIGTVDGDEYHNFADALKVVDSDGKIYTLFLLKHTRIKKVS